MPTMFLMLRPEKGPCQGTGAASSPPRQSLTVVCRPNWRRRWSARNEWQKILSLTGAKHREWGTGMAINIVSMDHSRIPYWAVRKSSNFRAFQRWSGKVCGSSTTVCCSFFGGGVGETEMKITKQKILFPYNACYDWLRDKLVSLQLYGYFILG